MKQIFVSSVQKEFERERAAIKRMIETDPIIKPHFKAFVFEIDAPAADKTSTFGRVIGQVQNSSLAAC